MYGDWMKNIPIYIDETDIKKYNTRTKPKNVPILTKNKKLLRVFVSFFEKTIQNVSKIDKKD